MMLETETIFDEFYEESLFSFLFRSNNKQSKHYNQTIKTNSIWASAQNFYIVERYSTRNQVPVVLIAVVRQNVSLSLRKNVYDYAVIRQHENK